ncbi:MAG TPA: hypothetical protein VK705_03390 [Ferruginibacter sp.]|jgi:hypothetical protein|nr:hypothetical protein [Ferruginibacter sp.]
MEFFITSDSWWETKVDKVVSTLYHLGYDRFFDKRNYGNSVNKIAIILMCREPHLKFKQRIRYLNEEKILYIDIMLDFYQFMDVEQKIRERQVAEKLISEVPPIIAKYKFPDFDLPKFEKDFKKFMSQLL